MAAWPGDDFAFGTERVDGAAEDEAFAPKDEAKPMRGWAYLLLWLPAACDLTGTTVSFTLRAHFVATAGTVVRSTPVHSLRVTCTLRDAVHSFSRAVRRSARARQRSARLR